MKAFFALNKLTLLAIALICTTALLIVALWGNKYAGYYIAWILLIGYFTWQSRH
jgi:purine-cytosine permease-like protein